MHIKEITMDGFKSYANKTSIRPLDPKYTAITGLNGVGKSNVIDAVIFALGLENKKTLRVSTMKELINTTRKECKVTILFTGTQGMAPAYAHLDEISVSRSLDSEGRSKYEINGHTATSKSVERLCSSFNIGTGGGQLFIIMQGHITKVLSMKSSDLQALVEDTAGTRSFVREKEKALIIIERKENKLKEAREAFERRIAPFFDKLKNQREEYMNTRNAEEMKKEYSQYEDQLKNMINMSKLKKIHDSLKSDIETYLIDKQNLDDIEEKLSQLNNLMSDDNFVSLKEELEDYIMKIEEIQNSGLEKEIQSKNRELEEVCKMKSSNKLFELKAREEILVKSIKESHSSFDRGSSISKIEELSNLKIKKTEIECGLKNTQLDGDYSEDKLQNFEKLIVDENELSTKKNRCLFLKAKINYPFIDGVYGTVDENIHIDDDMYREAVYTIMGSKGKHVIVRDDTIGTGIIEKSDRRISVIPLNKISSKNVPLDLIKKVRKDGGIHLLEILNYDTGIRKAIEHVFSGFFIFKDKEAAKKVCFESNVICITLDGTVYDPKGTLTGGKSVFKSEVIKRKEIEALEREIGVMEDNMYKFGQIKREYLRLIKNKERLEKKTKLDEELSLINKKIEMLEKICSKSFDLEKELKNIRNLILNAVKDENRIKESHARKQELLREIDEIKKRQEKNSQKIGEYKEKVATLQRKVQEKEILNSNRRLSERQAESLEPKQKYLIKNTRRLYNKIHKVYNEYVEIKNSLNITDISTYLCELCTGSLEHRALSGEFKENFEELEIGCDVLSFNIIKYASVLLNRFSEEFKGFKYIDLRKLYSNNEIIVDNNDFDKSANFMDIKTIDDILEYEEIIIERLNYTQEFLRKLSRRKSIKMDPSNFELLEKNEIAIKNLQEKITKIEHDKAKIISSIKNLDVLGTKENEKAFQHINSRLGPFLRYFFKDADAKIEKSDEYELRVKIGNWKESLLELSGGQRSLVALCLVFSMLTYKPSPFYIFDEIDSALDMSYTQSIGEIIKNEFSGSQFLIVSLKNGMYENANSVFKVYLRDGKPAICQIK